MKYDWKKILVFALIIAFYASLLIYKIQLPVADDMARHVTNGEFILQGNIDVLYENFYSYTAAGHPFVNHHWFSGVIFYLLHEAIGWEGLVVFKVIVLLATFLLLFKLALKKADFWLVALLALPTIFILMERTSLRPEIFSYLLIAVYLYLLVDLNERPQRKWIFLLIPLQLLWVNSHIFFSIGIMLVAGFLLEKILLVRPTSLLKKFSVESLRNIKNDPLVRKLTLLLVSLIVVSGINPNGIKGMFYRYPADFPIKISENQSPMEFSQVIAFGQNISIPMFYAMVFVLALSFIYAFWKGRRPYFYLFAAIATATLGFVILRGTVFFGMLFLPIAAMNLQDLFVRTKDWFAAEMPRIAGRVGNVLIATLAGAYIFLILPSTYVKLSPDKQFGIGLTPYSQSSAEFFKTNNLRGPIFNDTDSGSYLIYNLYPEERVFSDNLFGDAYPASFFSDVYLPMLEDENAWLAVSRRYDFNTIFLYQYDAREGFRSFIWRRIQDPAWALVYGDQYNIIFVRNIPEHQHVIERYGITAENAEERLRPFTQSGDFDLMVTAADIFNLLGREDLGAQTFQNVVANWPDKGKIWMIMGEWELRNADRKSSLLARMYFDKAISLGHGNAGTYSFLGVAYFNLGQYENAREAFRTALRINPERADAKDYLAQLNERLKAEGIVLPE